MDRLLDILLGFYGPSPYFLIFGILMVCGLGVIPLPEDITLFAAGLCSYYGLTNLWLVIVVAYLGVILGDSLIFWLGATYGRKLTKKPFFNRILPEERLTLVKSRFHKKGNHIIFAARFMPGLRAPMFFSAGTLHLPFKVFLFYDGLAALLSVPTIIGAVYYFGDQVDHAVRVIQKIEHGVILVLIAIILAFVGRWYLGHRKVKRSKAKLNI